MEGQWHFNELVPGMKIREAVQDEFFTADVIRGAAEALVREGVQNSLDAGISGQHVKVVISLGELEGSKQLRTLEPFVNHGWQHFVAANNGLTDVPGADESCRFLVFEDFGTTGLTGDTGQLLPIEGKENRFFHFFRVEGRSDKHDSDRGRWGIGKQVFPKASRIKTVFGLTKRSDDQTSVLMGQAILRSHKVGDVYFQDGWFGSRRQGDSRAVYPIAAMESIASFRKVFDISRGDSDAGLSLVVPYVHEEINTQEITAAVLRGYFYPILMGDLEVEIRASGSRLELTSQNLVEKVDTLDAELRAEIRPVINLALWVRNNKDQLPELNSPKPDMTPQWIEEIVPDAVRALVRENLQAKAPFGIRVPIDVRPRARGKPRRPSHFDVFLVRDDGESTGRPLFVREGIIISDVRGHRTRGIRSLVVVETGALATMLGDSENPAHTQWQKHGSKFKDKYYSGGPTIRYVADSAAELVRISTASEDQEDLSLLTDIFSIPAEEGEDGLEEEHSNKDSKDKKKTEKPEPPPDSARPRFLVSPLDGGFKVSPSSAIAELPMRVRVRAAYDVRRGNAFGKYNVADFRIEKMKVAVEGASIVKRDENEIIIEVTSPEFSATVLGFDPNRDVRVSVVRVQNDS